MVKSTADGPGTAPAGLVWGLRVALGVSLWVAGNGAYAGQRAVAAVAGIVALGLAAGVWRTSRRPV